MTSRGDRRRWAGRRGRRRLLVTALSLALALLVAGTGYVGLVAVRRGQPLVLPAPPGPYRVGRTGYDWTDRSRTDPVAPVAGRPRELSVWLWYPAAPGARPRPAPYAPGAWGQLHVPGPVGLFEGSFAAVRDAALDRPAVAPGRFPVVVLEPGMGFAAPQYAVLAEGLASRGFLVAGVTPTYSANVTVLHDRVVRSTDAGNPSGLGSRTGRAGAAADRLVRLWAQDARYAAAAVGRLDGAGPFAGRVRHGRVAYLGHSFGGAAALQACSTDPRCAGAVDLDGTQYGPVVQTGLPAPVLLLGSDGSCATGTCPVRGAEDRADRDAARSLLAATRGPAWCMSVRGAAHVNVTDDAVLYLAPPLRTLYALGSIDGRRGLRVEGGLVAAFLERVLRGAAPGALSDPGSSLPEVRAGCAPDPATPVR